MVQNIYRVLIPCNLVLLILVFTATAQEKTHKKDTFKYGGVKTCKPCHLVEKSGAQYKKWLAGPHARAYETLKSDKAKAWAKERNIAEPLESGQCIKCHVTAYEVSANLKGPGLALEEGVGCESCHGPGSEYKKLMVMRDIYTGKLNGPDYGLLEPTEKLCVTCHNDESPAYKGFNYDEMVAKIAHAIPEK